MKLPEYVYRVKRLVLSKHVGKWCCLSYQRHPKDCPNYNRKSIRPPQSGFVSEYFDLNRSLYFVHSEFNLSKHFNSINKMKSKHPDWSPTQCSCILYWQTSRKQLKNRVQMASAILGIDCIAYIPEAIGVNVYVTAHLSGLKLERIRHLNVCKHIALIGYKLNKLNKLNKFNQPELF